LRWVGCSAAALLLAACGGQGEGDAPAPAEAVPSAEAVAPGEPAMGEIWGDWVVRKASLSNPDGPVQAYGSAELDALKGLELTITSDEILWTGPHIDGDDPQYFSFRDACEYPQIVPGDTSETVAITCAGDTTFGPPGEQTRLSGDDSLTLPWYDGVTLELQRLP
tara:strand:+ start:47981 stop:48475 length:495 start_codon:yes stop_codon:yes gene_type:complete